MAENIRQPDESTNEKQFRPIRTNRDRVYHTLERGLGHNIAEYSEHVLAKSSLIAPDLPEPNDPNVFVPNGKGWLPCGPDGPSVWTAPGGTIMVQRVEPGDLTPEEARDVAHALLAGANYSEGKL